MNRLETRLRKLEVALRQPPTPFVVTTYWPGDDGFDAAVAEAFRDMSDEVPEVALISVIKGLEGHADDLTIINTIVDPKPGSGGR